MLEVEVKVKINIENAGNKLINLGFEKSSTVYEKDTYYNGEHKNLKSEDKALRIRIHKDLLADDTKYILNFKGPKLDNSTMTREETEFEISSYESGDIMLKGLGFSPAGVVEKTRVHYIKENITCCLDTVTKLGEFMEIEIMAEDKQGYDLAIARINELLSDFGLDVHDTIRTSYLSMLM